MKKENPIRDAIDESLCGIRFNAQDMRSVLRATRSREEPVRAPAKKRRVRLDLIFSTAMAVLVLVPLGLFAMHAQNTRTASIITAPGSPAVTVQPGEEATLTPEASLSASGAGVYSRSDAIRVARACFEANCDTSVFSFEEYTVSVSDSQDDNGCTVYDVNMKSIYDNGCTFEVIVRSPDGVILSYSTPRLATVPASLNGASEEVQAWYEKNGRYIFTWPQSEQAEFSRRYEGSTLRTAQAGEISAEQAAQIAQAACLERMGMSNAAAYPMLYAGNNFEDGIARYQIYCFETSVSDVLPETCLLVTLVAADGTLESIEMLETAEIEP